MTLTVCVGLWYIHTELNYDTDSVCWFVVYVYIMFVSMFLIEIKKKNGAPRLLNVLILCNFR